MSHSQVNLRTNTHIASVVHRRFAASNIRTREEQLTTQGRRVQVRSRHTPCFFNNLTDGVDTPNDTVLGSRTDTMPVDDLNVLVDGAKLSLQQRADLKLM